MSDEHETEEAGTGNADEGVSLSITHQYIKDLSFENPAAPGLYVDPPQRAPDVGIQVNVEAQRLAENRFEVTLHVEAQASLGDQPVFILELAYAALAEIGGVPEEHVQPLVLIEVPRMLFPFARAIVSAATRDGGFPPLLISNVDFVEMYRRGAEGAAPQAENMTENL